MAAIHLVSVELQLYKHTIDKSSYNYKQNSIAAKERIHSAINKMPSPSALDLLCSTFGLSDFERSVLLLAAGIELDSEFEILVSSLLGGDNYSLPSLSLVLAALPDAHWSTITPNAPLRYWRLIEVTPHQSITKSTFSIDEQVLNYLVGLPHMNESLFGITDPYLKQTELVPSHMEVVDQILQLIEQEENDNSLPVIQLFGEDSKDKLPIAAKVCSKIGALLYSMPLFSIPDNVKEISGISRLWNRETYLGSSALFLDCSEIDINDRAQVQRITRFCQKSIGLLFIGSRHWSPGLNRQQFVYNINRPSSDEQLSQWQKELGDDAMKLDGHLTRIVSQFNLSAQAISETSAELRKYRGEENQISDNDEQQLESEIWEACCKQTRPRLDDLAQRIEPVAVWDDIVLPDLQKNTLLEIASHVKQRIKVYKDWGFEKKSSRGLGISVLFSGESGTGKTMAAEILAKALCLDLYRIDLSQVVNKYIGETEKNLKKVFDAAETGGAVLLFDEADALFGKRSEVRDSHDRYANIEVSYLLQRMEEYRGLAILTTNLKSAMDKAFLRRIRFIVQFPFPDTEQRAEIWSKIFPSSAPLEGIDVKKLARLNIAGGNIRNIALNAAFIAAESDDSVKMKHIEKAARNEYTKLEKQMSNMEKGTW